MQTQSDIEGLLAQLWNTASLKVTLRRVKASTVTAAAAEALVTLQGFKAHFAHGDVDRAVAACQQAINAYLLACCTEFGRATSGLQMEREFSELERVAIRLFSGAECEYLPPARSAIPSAEPAMRAMRRDMVRPDTVRVRYARTAAGF